MNTFAILLLLVLLILISLLVSELVKQAKEIDALHISLDDAIRRLKDSVDLKPLRSSAIAKNQPRTNQEPTKNQPRTNQERKTTPKQPLNNP